MLSHLLRRSTRQIASSDQDPLELILALHPDATNLEILITVVEYQSEVTACCAQSCMKLPIACCVP